MGGLSVGGWEGKGKGGGPVNNKCGLIIGSS